MNSILEGAIRYLANFNMHLFFLLVLLISCWTLRVAGGSAPFISKTIVVDKNGYGDFKSVQDAVNSIPCGNKDWILIHVKAGDYWEKVLIPARKSYIVLEGEGGSKSVISYNDYSSVHSKRSLSNVTSNTMNCATFKVEANDFVARDIGFTNTYRSRDIYHSRPAVAAFVGGDRNSFYRCSFVAYQDTLCDYLGRHYFSNCKIQGAVDYIFGFGQSIYEESILVSTGLGWLTANAKIKPTDPSGFVFKNCKITAAKGAYLGRPWNLYATVIFYGTWMPSNINPLGWDTWHNQNTDQTLFVEAECSGPGSNTYGRVKWMKKLGPQQLSYYISTESFLGPDDWINNHPKLASPVNY